MILLQRVYAARGNRCDVCVCRLNGVFLFFISTLQASSIAAFTYGSLVFTFSPPVSGFSFLVRNFNFQSYSNNSRITVTTASGSVIHSVLTQAHGDINFIGWFQNGSSITSVALSPLTLRFSLARQYAMAMALDELRVYTRYTTAEPSTTPSSSPTSAPTSSLPTTVPPSSLPTASPSSLLDVLRDDGDSSTETATIWIWSGAGSFFLVAMATLYWCRHRRRQQCCKPADDSAAAAAAETAPLKQ
jgi:hypothetical protein